MSLQPSNNLFVVVELSNLEREKAVCDVVESVGEAIRVCRSTFYVRSALSAEEVATLVWNNMGSADQLLVLNTSRDEAATFNVKDDVLNALLEQWHQDVARSS